MGKRRHKVNGYNVYMNKDASDRYESKGGGKGVPTTKKVRGMKYLSYAGDRVYMSNKAYKRFKSKGGF